MPALAHAGSPPLFKHTGLRGGLDAPSISTDARTIDRQSRAFQMLLDQAAAKNAEIVLPPGRYEISGITLPINTRISGTRGATVLVHKGDGFFMTADGARNIELRGLVIDGANRWLPEETQGLLTLRNTENIVIADCDIRGSSRFGLWLERSACRVENNTISGAREAAIYAVECSAGRFTANDIFDCGNGGILVHRWSKGHDGALVTANRIARIGAAAGGTGQNGNGINIFRADGVIVSQNQIADCAFSAIRSNSSSNIEIVSNQCLRSGEMAIYSEFGFEGAIISQNTIDGAANGIAAVNFNEGGRLAIINANIVRNLHLSAPYAEDGQYFGIGISAEAEAVVSNNVIENVPLWGMQIGWGPYLRNVNVSGNIVRKAKVGCAISTVDGTGAALIRGNQFSGIEEAAIAGFHWAEKVTGELADKDQAIGTIRLADNMVV